MGLLRRVEDIRTGALTEAGTPPGELEEKFIEYHKMFGNLNCVLFDSSNDAVICQKMSRLIDKLGTVISLDSGHTMLLLPPLVDRELIAHRLSKSLDTKPLLTFEADSPEKAIDQIKIVSNKIFFR